MNKAQQFLQNLLGIKVKKPKANLVPFSTLATYGLPIDEYNLQELINNMNKGWVYACIKKIAEEVAKVEINLYKKIDEDIEEVKEHEVLDLLDRVNSFLTFYELKEITFNYLEGTGNAFWWLVKNDHGNEILEIWPYLSPANMTIVPSASEFIDHYEYKIPGGAETVRYEIDEIIHFKYFNTKDPYYGIGPFKAAELPYCTDEKAAFWNYRFFKNQARPAGMIEFNQPLTDTQMKQAVEAWEKQHAEGKEHSVGFIGGGNYKDVGLSQKDMDFNAQRRFARDEILAIFGVPKSVLGIVEDVNRANAEVSRITFLKETIVPKVIKFVNYLNEFLLPHYNDDTLFFDYINPIPEDQTMKLDYYANGRNNGWLAPNEIREMENFESFDGGDEVTVNAMPMKLPIGSIGTPNKIGKINKVKIKHIPNVKPKSRTKVEVMKDRLEKVGIKKSLAKKKNLVQKDITKKLTISLEEKNRIWEKKVAITDLQEAEMVRLLKREFDRQEKEVLSSLEKTKAIKYDFNIKKETKIFIDIFDPFISALVAKWGEDALRDLGLELDFDTTDEMLEWIRTEGLQFAEEVNQYTKEKISGQISEGVKAGESEREVTERIKGIFDEATTTRAQRIARTEISKASGEAALEAWKQSGVVVAKQWLTAKDERVCDYCRPMDERVIPLDSDFFKKGDEYFGESDRPLETLWDVDAGTLHVNCRCITRPITIEVPSYSYPKKPKPYNKKIYNKLVGKIGKNEAMSKAVAKEQENKKIQILKKEIDKMIDG